jgi:hypothetical protein
MGVWLEAEETLHWFVHAVFKAARVYFSATNLLCRRSAQVC